MKMIKTLTIVLVFFLLANIVYSNEANIDVLARSFIDSLVAERFTEIEMSFTEELSKAIPGETLKAVWESIISTLGKFNEILDIKITEYKEYRIASVICDFERGTLEIQITFDKELRIAGLYFLQPQFKATYTPPSYANQDSFTEIEVVLGDGKWKLPGLLTLPKTDKPYPAVVLVHGSGPNDKDETIGTNKPFKDLAWGLASRGIAVLRYEKRTRYYGEESLIEGFTVNEEVIEDVISAVDFLYQREEIDKNKIFILGHSLGGMLAPRIAEKTDKVRGIIMLAGTIKDLLEIIPKQAKYLASLDSKITEEEMREIEDLEKKIEDIKSSKVGKDENILGAPGSYWLDLINYNPLESIKNLELPILVLQGDRDYQVTVDDFKLWQEELKDKPNVTFKLYKGLNHLFIYGEGKSTTEEYYRPGNVSQEVIEDIANWIKISQI
ncbi:MAG: alpha/beta fold hydrolase [Dictyoglomi bacterium]|nr:alpha/beta fold hydrolase [Dictyoglomota bacterium]